MDAAAHLAEGATLAGFVTEAGPLAAPLTRGGMAGWFWDGLAGLAACAVVRRLPVRPETWRWTRLAASAFGQAGGFALR